MRLSVVLEGRYTGYQDSWQYVMNWLLDHAMNEIWSKQPGFSDMMGLAKRNLEIDAQIEAAIKRNEDMNRAIAEAEYIANQQG